MSHKAGSEFFDRKQEWSRYKDLILAYYLKPYLAKVKKLGNPILLVDLFAGPGRFGDGSVGSPIILLEAATELRDAGYPISVLLAEHDRDLIDRLRHNVESFGALADVRHIDSITLVNELAQKARTHTILLYVDPFSVSRLHLGHLGNIYSCVDAGSSVELLFVFMAHTFMRWAAACKKAESGASHVLEDDLVNSPESGLCEELAEAVWDAESVRIAKYAITSRGELDAIAGGDYWRPFVTGDDQSYAQRLEDFVEAYCLQLRRWFALACKFPITSLESPQLPKYWMIFGTRYRPAIDLINRAVATARQAQYTEWKKGTLFATAEFPRSVSASQLRGAIIAIIDGKRRVAWKSLRWEVSERFLGEFTDSEINAAIKHLLLSGRLCGATGARVEENAFLSTGSATRQ